MASDVVIRVERLGKRYTLGAGQTSGRYTALRDVVAEKTKSLMRRTFSRPAGGRDEPAETDFWALKDVSFEVRRGEVVGIIGRNGAGKSTLLKILSRITEPTEGTIRLRGRVASLLEVGTGFHPELTGRENIFLNGAILGMHRHEIKAKFDEIVAFAEVERFLDTPVKRYSSGMYVRLAFAVAAHLEPEILIVDEVLAVGDAEFQKKCLGKMHEVSRRSGRTVLFVSHNIAAVRSLCTRAVFLKSGKVFGIGKTEDQIVSYLREAKPVASSNRKAIMLNEMLELGAFAFEPNPVETGKPVNFYLKLVARAPLVVMELAALIYSSHEIRVAILDLRSKGGANFRLGPAIFSAYGTIQDVPLVEGTYRVGLYIKTDLFAGDFLDLAELKLHRMQTEGMYLPYPAQHRGFVELGFTMDTGASS